MAGNSIGARKTRDKLKQRDPDFYKKIGKIGGKISKRVYNKVVSDEKNRVLEKKEGSDGQMERRGNKRN